MILDISDKKFKELFKNKDFHLPIRWDGYDLPQHLVVCSINILNN